MCTPITQIFEIFNSDFSPLHHPFTKEFNIESYNTYWFNDEPDSATPKLMHKANESIPEEVDVDISTNLRPQPMVDTPAERS